MVEHNERLRVQMSANKALSLYPKEKVEKAIEDFYTKADRLNKNEEKKRLLRSLERVFVQEAKAHQILMDATAPEAKRISAIRNVRNYTFHFHVDDYLDVIRDTGNPLEARVVMTEALGWFTNSIQRPHILGEIKKIQETANLPEDLKVEIEQTIKRLSLEIHPFGNCHFVLAYSASTNSYTPQYKNKDYVRNCGRSEKL